MDAHDVELRNHIYRRFVTVGRAPRVSEVATELGIPPSDAADAFRRLHDAHALVLEQGTLEIRMANPFSAVPSAWRVHANDRVWYANCAWDAFGVCGALHVDGHISASCADCGEPLEIDVVDARPQPDDVLFHVLVPATHWWDDIVFT